MARLYPVTPGIEGFFGFIRTARRRRAAIIGLHFRNPDSTYGGTPMSDLQARFDQAQIDVKQLSERPSNMSLLRLYALFKQGSEGDAHGDKPGMTDFVGRYKFEAWEALRGTAREQAMEQYIALVEELRSGAAS
jgi:acyl-CoA-binding protein